MEKRKVGLLFQCESLHACQSLAPLVKTKTRLNWYIMEPYLLCSVGYEERTMKDSYFKTNDASIFARLHSEPLTPKILGVDLCLFPYNPLKNLGVHLANLRRDLWVECTLLYSAGRVVHLRQQNTLWIQNCRASIHPRRTKNKSYGQRKKPFLKEVHSLPVQTRLRHDGTRTIWARDSPFSSFFFFPLVSDLTKKNVQRNRLSAFFPPHTSYTRKCYAFTRKNEYGLEIYVYGRYCYKFYKDELGLVANV